jgi:glycosyltransferase involved in cell wall biosynthesis
MRPAVSVVITSYNRLPFLPATVASLRAQTFKDWELVLVDDGSTDETRRWARILSLEPMTFIRLPRRRGIAAARNRALARTRGRFIAFIDSDDLWRPRYLETMLAYFRRSETMMTVSNYDSIDAEGRVTHRAADRPTHSIDEPLRRVSGLRAAPCFSGCIFRRKVFDDIGGFDTGFQFSDDLDLFYRVAYRYGPQAIRFRRAALVQYRRHPGQITAVRGSLDDTGQIARTFLAKDSLVPAEKAYLLDMAYFHRKHAARLTDDRPPDLTAA